MRLLPEAARGNRLSWCSSLYHVSRDYIELHEEAKGHPAMLREWMIAKQLGGPALALPTKETLAFIAIMYRVALALDTNMSLLILNSTSEGLALDFFGQVHQRLHEAGYSNLEYFVAHEAMSGRAL